MKELTLVSEFPSSNFETPDDFSVGEFLLRKVKERSRVCGSYIIDPISKTCFGFGTFENQVKSVANSFYQRGMRRGDSVILLTKNLVNLPSLLTGIWLANGSIRILENIDQVRINVEESRAGWIICDAKWAKGCSEIIRDIYWEVQIILVDAKDDQLQIFDTLAQFYDNDDEEPPEIEVGNDAQALVVPSGDDAFVIHTHSTLLAILNNLSQFPWSEVNLILTKVTSLGILLPFCSLICGGTCLVMSEESEEFEEKWSNAINLFRPSFIFNWDCNLTFDTGKVENSYSVQFFANGNFESEAVIKLFPNLKEAINVFALPEALISSSLNFDENKIETAPSSVGKVWPGCLLQIRYVKSNQNTPLGPGQIGEIWVKSNTLFREYFNCPQENERFNGGWFRTGIEAYYNEDGFIFLKNHLF